MTRIFHWFYMWKMYPISGCDIRLVFTLPPRDSTLQYKRCEHLWNNFLCISTLYILNFYNNHYSWYWYLLINVLTFVSYNTHVYICIIQYAKKICQKTDLYFFLNLTHFSSVYFQSKLSLSYKITVTNFYIISVNILYFKRYRLFHLFKVRHWVAKLEMPDSQTVPLKVLSVQVHSISMFIILKTDYF